MICVVHTLYQICVYSSFRFVPTMFVCSCNRNTLTLGFEYILTIKIKTIFNGHFCPTKHKGNGGDTRRWKKLKESEKGGETLENQQHSRNLGLGKSACCFCKDKLVITF